MEKQDDRYGRGHAAFTGILRRGAAAAGLSLALLAGAGAHSAWIKPIQLENASGHECACSIIFMRREMGNRGNERELEVTQNWAGYIADPDPGAAERTVTGVSGSWIVQDVSRSIGQTDSAQWIGIGGSLPFDKTLIQAGTESECLLGKTDYYAWIEGMPQEQRAVEGMTIKPGDVFSASIQQVPEIENGWVIRMMDVTRSEGVTITVSYRSSMLGAEWIEERACIFNKGEGKLSVLADFGTTYFGREYTGGLQNAVRVGGGISNIAEAPNRRLVLSYSDGNKFVSAWPSALAGDGSSFAITYNESAIGAHIPWWQRFLDTFALRPGDWLRFRGTGGRTK